MTLVCPILFMGPSAVGVTPAVDSHVRPTSVEGKAYIEAAAHGDLDQAAKIGMERTFNKFPGVTFTKELPGGPKLKMLAVTSGACLEPHIKDGDSVICEVDEPLEGQLVGFNIKGQPQDFKFLKVFIKTLYRGDNYIATFGENQPDKIQMVFQTNPLSLVLIADRDTLDFWRRVSTVIRRDQTVWNVDKYPLSAEQEQAIQAAMDLPSI